MTKVDFHILATTQESDFLTYVVRLTQKARSRGHQVLIATDQAEQSLALSTALWGIQPDAFIAHSTIDAGHDAIQISDSEQCGSHHDVLINLRQAIPEFFSRFERVFEVVSQQPSLLPASRQRYRFYSDRGYALTRHDLRDRV
ncbi:MAG: DNA polymerase III subunit chi [OM182 bacterium]|jgi:DNA polymerase-3 subunit chi|nr:DNA polymerase III subunit chi [OM182 bacterium]|tara:strand:+ start:2737 stop:3165 length:429 start_codon:yes stop_codon:yes gene_type:complete